MSTVPARTDRSTSVGLPTAGPRLPARLRRRPVLVVPLALDDAARHP
ncbi:hypothetical protein ABC795_16150 [Blastococcus sp. HT6-30]